MRHLCVIAMIQFAFIVPVVGCRDDEVEPSDQSTSSGARGQPPPTNRIDVPDAVRRNLGITFAKVESRPVSRTLRVPGRFEFRPDARREYRTMLAGRVELRVGQYQRVEPGTPLYRLDSPPWRDLQRKLAETEAHIREAEKRVEMMTPLLEAHEQHHRSIQEQVRVLTEQSERLKKGAETGSVSAGELADIRATLAEANTKLAETKQKEAELAIRRVEASSGLEAARTRFDLFMDSAATLLDIPKSDLANPTRDAAEARPLWRVREHVEVTASAGGYVESLALTNGSWAAATSLVLTTVQPERIRFHAHGMQSDLGRLREGLSARIVSPRGGSVDLQDTMFGRLSLGISADPRQRTVDLYVAPDSLSTWARPGVTAHLEITLASGADEPAIPVGSVIQDGVKKILFRRDPKNPDKVIRMDADLGVSDGRWVVVQSGLRAGDEVVLDGIYQLMLATSTSAAKGGHFHPDGTWHDGNE